MTISKDIKEILSYETIKLCEIIKEPCGIFCPMLGFCWKKECIKNGNIKT